MSSFLPFLFGLTLYLSVNEVVACFLKVNFRFHVVLDLICILSWPLSHCSPRRHLWRSAWTYRSMGRQEEALGWQEFVSCVWSTFEHNIHYWDFSRQINDICRGRGSMAISPNGSRLSPKWVDIAIRDESLNILVWSRQDKCYCPVWHSALPQSQFVLS